MQERSEAEQRAICHASLLILGEWSEATEPYNKNDIYFLGLVQAKFIFGLAQLKFIFGLVNSTHTYRNIFLRHLDQAKLPVLFNKPHRSL